MEGLIGTLTNHAMNYAIRSGIAVTASFAIGSCSRLLKTVDNRADFKELQGLQERLGSKIRIISPAIDLIELISARGNTTLESAVELTKGLRWDIQSLGLRLEKAAATEEASRKKSDNAKSKETHEVEIQEILQDIKQLLTQIEDAVPLLSLAITTSGVSLSTTLPPTVSPSRMLQASAYLNAGDSQYYMSLGQPTQIGPSFTLSLYMLFSGHTYREHDEENKIRETTWKEVLHKARVRIIRSSGDLAGDNGGGPTAPLRSVREDDCEIPVMPGQGIQHKFAYHLEIIEDLEDDRMHDFEDASPKPGPFNGVLLAGIQEIMPVYQVSKIFYADTGKLLNIGGDGGGNNPILLLKRDINAAPSRQMMKEDEKSDLWEEYEQEQAAKEEEYDSEEEANEQLRRESSVLPEDEPVAEESLAHEHPWSLPADLDPEWLAFEVYTEDPDSDSGTEEGDEPNDDSAYASHRPSSTDADTTSDNLAEQLNHLNLASSSPSPSPAHQYLSTIPQLQPPTPMQNQNQPAFSPFGPIRSSLSLLEMLIRLTILQQYEQKSHLAIPDETLTFFLDDSASTGAGRDSSLRRRTRQNAKNKVGFDPYDESPVKRRGAPYQEDAEGERQGSQFDEERHYYEREGTPYSQVQSQDYGRRYSRGDTPQRQYSGPLAYTPNPFLLREREHSSARHTPETSNLPPSSPILSPYRPVKKAPVQRLQKEGRRFGKGKGSPLGRGMSVDTDSSLGTSPGSPTLVDRREKV